jgi:hypothetical protein
VSQAFLPITDDWVVVKDGNDLARSIFDGHYSRVRRADGRKSLLFVGPGEKFVLVMADGSAVCAWRKFIDDSGQQGVNCAIYRRERGEPASQQLRAAMALALDRWPGQRLYTYVDPLHVSPTWRAGRPTWGHCFYQAGWRFEGMTKGRLHVLAAYQEHP